MIWEYAWHPAPTVTAWDSPGQTAARVLSSPAMAALERLAQAEGDLNLFSRPELSFISV